MRSPCRPAHAGRGAERQRDEREAEANGKEECRSEDVVHIGALEVNAGKPDQTHGAKKRPEGREHSRSDPLEELGDELRCHCDAEREGKESEARHDRAVAIGFCKSWVRKKNTAKMAAEVHNMTAYAAARLRLAKSRSGMRG